MFPGGTTNSPVSSFMWPHYSTGGITFGGSSTTHILTEDAPDWAATRYIRPEPTSVPRSWDNGGPVKKKPRLILVSFLIAILAVVTAVVTAVVITELKPTHSQQVEATRPP